ncbi:MAG TPA: hypothetical protein VMU34_08385, partial [Mycobacterium sp.]|nr:hypothetical protein [Mycobacterium sp.]
PEPLDPDSGVGRRFGWERPAAPRCQGGASPRSGAAPVVESGPDPCGRDPPDRGPFPLPGSFGELTEAP